MSLPVEKTLQSLRIFVIKEDGDERWALCPGHKKRTGKDDHNPSWSINVETGAHNCFSCGYKGSLFTLVRDLRSEEAAKALMAEVKTFGRPVSTSDNVRRHRDIQRPDDSGGLNSLPKSWIAVYGQPPEWARDRRRVDRRSVEAYDVRWDVRKKAWILPLYSPTDHSRLIGYQVKGEGTRYFRNQPRSMEKARTLFGLPVAEDHVVVVESPLDAVLLYRLGFDAVAICGSRVSDAQLRLLRKYDGVTFALDNDNAGQKETRRLKGLIRARFMRYPGSKYKDVGEMPDSAIRLALGR